MNNSISTERVIAEEQALLSDVWQQTGLRFRHIGGISTHDDKIAEVVLPILARWVDFLLESGVRAEVYSRFDTRAARQFLGEILAWWRKEEDLMSKDVLVQVLEVLVTKSNATQIWKSFLDMNCPRVRLTLLRKLAEQPEISGEVRATILYQLQTFPDEKIAELTTRQLLGIAKIGDPAIEAWFASQRDTTNPRLMKVISQIAPESRQHRILIPYTNSFPDQFPELASLEIDLQDFRAILKEQAKRLNFKIPEELLSLNLFDAWEPDRWTQVALQTPDYRVLSLWLRLKDETAVEIRVTTD